MEHDKLDSNRGVGRRYMSVYCTMAFKDRGLDSSKSRDRVPIAVTNCFNHARSSLYLLLVRAASWRRVLSFATGIHLARRARRIIVGQRGFQHRSAAPPSRVP